MNGLKCVGFKFGCHGISAQGASGLITLFERGGREHQGRALDTAVLIELRALKKAAAAQRKARAFLVTLDARPPPNALPRGLNWAPAARWLLEEMRRISET